MWTENTDWKLKKTVSRKTSYENGFNSLDFNSWVEIFNQNQICVE